MKADKSMGKKTKNEKTKKNANRSTVVSQL